MMTEARDYAGQPLAAQVLFKIHKAAVCRSRNHLNCTIQTDKCRNQKALHRDRISTERR